MHRSYPVLGALLAGLSVGLGAFGAHGLQKLTQDAKIIQSFQTGVQYQLYHSLALLVIYFYYLKFNDKLIIWAANLFIAGIIFFSGSLYLLSFFKLRELPYSFLGPVTPAGGICFITGWLLLFIAFLRFKKNN